jgi:hypothetical protein
MANLTSVALVGGGATWGVPVADQSFDNTKETPPKDAAGRYAVINISFPQTVIQDIGCEGADRIVGTCNVLLYTPKREGMKPAEEALLAVTKAWVGVNRRFPSAGVSIKQNGVSLATRDISGPNALASDQRPHQVTSLSCAFTARIDAVAAPVP